MSWSLKKLGIVSLGCGIGVVFGLAALAFTVYRYQHPSAGEKDWPAIELPMLGIRAQLHTEVRSGTIAYIYSVEPVSPKFAEDFDRVANDSTVEKSFDVTLRDKAGFELCEQQVNNLVMRFNDEGKAMQLSSEGTMYCPARDYLHASDWQVTWNFPRLAALPKGFVPDELKPYLTKKQAKVYLDENGNPIRPPAGYVAVPPPEPRSRPKFDPNEASSSATANRTAGTDHGPWEKYASQAAKTERGTGSSAKTVLFGLYGSVGDCNGGVFLYDNAALTGSPVGSVMPGTVLRVWPSGYAGSYAAQIEDFQTETVVHSGFVATECISKTWQAPSDTPTVPRW